MNSSGPTDERHLSPQGFAEYLAAGIPVAVPIVGEPPAMIFIDPARGRIGLRSPVHTDATAPPSPLENLHFTIVSIDGAPQLEIASSDPDLFNDVYSMLCAVADRIQLEGKAPLAALEETLAIWGRVLARRSRLSHDQEVGLVGELLLLRALMTAWTVAEAVASWRGPAAEEHDFGLPELDLEVKTTTSERRRHWITTLTQLVPTRSRPLWLISIQVTRAGSGHGSTLPDLIGTLRSLITDEVIERRFEEVLRVLHWSDSQADLYADLWELRSAPRALLVDTDFPALTPNVLARAGFPLGDLTQLRYELDLSERQSSVAPRPLLDALERLT